MSLVESGRSVAVVVPKVVRRAGARELALVAVVYAAYDASRFLVEGRQRVAFANAQSLLHFESALRIDAERALNLAVSTHQVIAVIADYLYATTHYIVTPLVLVWLWRRHRDVYSQARSTLMVATILGLVGFALLPVAPPRMLHGFVDTMSRYSTSGWWGTDASAPRGTGHLTNEFAAMPSLHVGWALWCGWQLMHHARTLLLRSLGVAYPIVTALVVIGTGNHYVVDALAGAVLIGLAGLLVSAAWRLWTKPRREVRQVIDLTNIPRQMCYASASPPELTTDRATVSESVVMPSTPNCRS
jgi:hypothetical protein